MIARIIEEATGLRSLAYFSGKRLLEEATRHHPLAVFVDIGLEAGECGLDLIPKLRLYWPHTPLLVVTGDPADEAVSRALGSGADDFLLKPIRIKELVARLQTRLAEESRMEMRHTLRFGEISLDPSQRILKGPLGTCYLSPTETGILLGLIEAKGTVVAKDKLKRQAWKGISVTDNALDRKLYELRRSLEEVSGNTSIRALYRSGLALESRPCRAAENASAPAKTELNRSEAIPEARLPAAEKARRS